MSEHQNVRGDPRSVLWASIPLGIGLVGALDEIVFHQLLQWHNFYVDAGDRWRIFSDGLLHTFTLSMLFFGAGRLWKERMAFSSIVTSKPFWAGVLLGGGGFQLWDGLVDHKLLRLHPVREDAANILVYDIAWITSALVLLAIGLAILRSIEPAHVTETPARTGGPRNRSRA
jgi:uncharacterized membrane protein